MTPSSPLSRDRITALVDFYPALAGCRGDVRALVTKLVAVFASGGKLLICGNGGSASDAEHIASELLKSFARPRPLDPAIAARLGAPLAAKLQAGLPVVPLTGFPGFATAWANDCDRDFIYAQLVLALGRPGDALLAISTSGNATNVLHAVDTARALGVFTVGLSGQSGGKLKPKLDLCVCAPAQETYRIQEYHLPIYHAICLSLEDHFFG